MFTLMIWEEYIGVMQGGKRVAEERSEVKGEGPACGNREGSGMLERKETNEKVVPTGECLRAG